MRTDPQRTPTSGGRSQVFAQLRKAKAQDDANRQRKDRLIKEHLAHSMTRQIYSLVFVVLLGVTFLDLGVGMLGMRDSFAKLASIPWLIERPVAWLLHPAEPEWHLGTLAIGKVPLVALLVYGFLYRAICVAHEMVTEERTEVK